MRIYITYCSREKDDKDDSLKNTGKDVTPDKLYANKHRIQPFMRTCINKKIDWAIFSDKYGVWFPKEKHEWYDKPPDCVTEEEFKNLLKDFDSKLQSFDEIWFYYKCYRRLHSLYKRLLQETSLKNRITEFHTIKNIV